MYALFIYTFRINEKYWKQMKNHLTEEIMNKYGQKTVLHHVKIYKAQETFQGAYMSTISAVIRDV